MLMGSISPGPRYNINILFYFNKSRDFVDMRANINQALSTDLNHDNDNDNEHGNNGATTTPPPPPPQLNNNNNNNNNEGRGRVEHEKSAQTTRLALSGH